MIIRDVELTKDFVKNFNNLPEDVKVLVREILKSLEYGNNVKGTFHVRLERDLKIYTAIHFWNNKYRLIYRCTKSKLKVIVLMVGKRSNSEDFYEKFKRYRKLRKL